MSTLSLRDVDASYRDLTPTQADMLRALLRRRGDYLCEGRWQEARGVGIATLIVWQHLLAPSAELPTTQMGDL